MAMKKAVLFLAMALAAAGTMTAAQAQEVGRVLSSTPVVQDNRTVGYDVQYEYGGKQYSARLPYDPGQTIRLQVSPAQDNSAQGQFQAPPQGAEQGGAPGQQSQATILREVPSGARPAYGA